MPKLGEIRPVYFKCLYCPAVFKQLKLLIAHYNLNHAPEGRYIFRQGNGKDEKIAGLGEGGEMADGKV